MSIQVSFKGKKVLVTGAARGLGRDLVEFFHKGEAVVYALSRNPENLQKLKTEFPNIITVCADLSDWDGTRKAVEKIPPVDYLVNNAAIVQVQAFADITPENFDLMMNTNVKSVINVSQIVAQKMIDSKMPGAIVNVSSLASKLYGKMLTTYCLTKASLDMLTKSMAVELGPFNIRVNSVNPTVFLSDMSRTFLENNPDGGETYVGRVPLKKIVTSEEIVRTIAYLLSDLSPMIHGETIALDGGYSCT